MNSPVHRIKQKMSYQRDSVQQSVTPMAQSKKKLDAMSSWGWLSRCESMPDNPDCIFQCWSFSVDFVLHVSLLKILI